MKNLILSYKTLRKAIGILALCFPFMLILFGALLPQEEWQPSISRYYWTDAHDIFVGMLVCIGMFLLSYHGYDKWDKILASLGGSGILIVALFPCFSGPNTYTLSFLSPQAVAIIHTIGALIAFSSLGCISYFCFTKSNDVKKNLVYRTCGLIIFICIGLVPISKMSVFEPIKGFFWIENIIVLSFGVSWLVKGTTSKI